MKSELKRILRRSALIVTLTAFCISGSYVFAHKHPEAAEQASASASAPVIVLDAGHGASP